MVEAIPYIGGALGGLAAVVTAIVMVLRYGVDKADNFAAVKIGSAHTVMVDQQGFIEELRESVRDCNERADTAIGRVQELSREVDKLRSELHAVTVERDQLRRERDELLEREREREARVQHLEQRVEDLTRDRQIPGPAGPPGPRGHTGATGQGPVGPQGPTGRDA